MKNSMYMQSCFCQDEKHTYPGKIPKCTFVYNQFSVLQFQVTTNIRSIFEDSGGQRISPESRLTLIIFHDLFTIYFSTRLVKHAFRALRPERFNAYLAEPSTGSFKSLVLAVSVSQCEVVSSELLLDKINKFPI